MATLPVFLDHEKGIFLQPTRFLDRSGTTTLFELDPLGETRTFLSVDPSQPDHFSPHLIQTVVTFKQEDFWASPGFSMERLTDPEPATIAEALVCDLLLDREMDGMRKALRMRLLAGQLVAKFGRSQVLEWYLNSLNFGHGAYGAQSASQLYFGKSAADLDLLEAAFLVRVSETPVLNPLDAPGLTEELKQETLDRLLTQGIIGADQYVNYKNSQLVFRVIGDRKPQDLAAFIRLAEEQLGSRIGAEMLERGGLNVITSLDIDLQSGLACTMKVQMARLSGQAASAQQIASDCEASRLLPTIPTPIPALPEMIQASAVITDPRSGEVLALLGESTFQQESALTRGHAPGSLLTPFVALAVFARGYSPASLVWDIPSVLPAGLEDARNPDGSFHGPVRLRIALANDYLAPIAQLLDQINASNLWRILEPLGVAGVDRGDAGASVLFDGGLLTPLQAAQAYGVLATGGYSTGIPNSISNIPDLRFVLEVQDSMGNSIEFNGETDSQAVISSQLAYLVNNVLSDETARWPSLGNPNALEIGRPAGGKIGQVSGKNEIWAVGYTPQRVVSIWMGLPDGSQGYQLESRMPAGISHALLQYASQGQSIMTWDMPLGVNAVRVCDPSGLLPTRTCPEIVEEIFLTGSEPVQTDNLYQEITINRETGRMATVFTPPELLREETFMVVPEAVRPWAEAAGLNIPPAEYDIIQQPLPIAGASIISPEMFSYVRGKVAIRGSAGGEDFSGYRVEVGAGLNPQNWLQVGSGDESIQDNLLAEWDSTGKDGLYAIRLLVLRSEQRFDTATIQVAVDNTLPEVSIPYPQQDAIFKLNEDQAITLQVSAEDEVGINRVEWWIDNTRVGVRDEIPYVQTWPLTKGTHILFVRVFDLAGNMGESQPVSFTVQ